jgi:sulfur-carrier protein
VTVQVRIPTLLRSAAGGNAKVAAEGATVGEVLDAVVKKYPALAPQVLAENGSLHRFVNVYVNDDDVRYLDRLDTRVAPSDVVSILPAVAGGSA